LEIKLLGACCSGNCSILERNLHSALKELNLNVSIERIDDLPTIINYGCLQVPGLVINGKLISQGNILTVEQLKDILTEFSVV
jgi:hypothetical protein